MDKFPKIASVESFIISIPRATPYLGPLGPGEFINSRGYLIRQGNRSIYPSSDMSVLVKITADDGTVGCLFEADDYARIVFARFPIEWALAKP